VAPISDQTASLSPAGNRRTAVTAPKRKTS
jgi:hypothetical protein